MTVFIPYDCSRCHGYMQVKDNLLVSCNSRETCKRYLARKDIGERTPFILPECDNNEKCEHYWEHKEDTPDGRTDS